MLNLVVVVSNTTKVSRRKEEEDQLTNKRVCSYSHTVQF